MSLPTSNVPKTLQSSGIRLDTLPQELLVMIAEQAEPRDVVNFRSVCKKFLDAASTPFKNEFFSDILVFMSKASLEALVSICAHPAFGKHVKSISFASQIIESPREDKIAEWKRVWPANLLGIEEQISLQTSGEALGLLTAALVELREKDQPVTLRLCDYVLPISEPESLAGAFDERPVKRGQFIKEAPHPKRALGLSKFKQKFQFGPDMYGIREVQRTSVLKFLIEAAFDSGCRVPRLNISIEHKPLSDMIGFIYEDDLVLTGWKGTVMYKLRNVAERLECLELSSVRDTHLGHNYFADDGTALAFGVLTDHARRLKILRVALNHHIIDGRHEARMGDPFRTALQACTSTGL